MAAAPTVAVAHKEIINDRWRVSATLTAGADTYGNIATGLPVVPQAYGMAVVDEVQIEPLDSGTVGSVGRFIPQYDPASGRIRLYFMDATGATAFGSEIPGVLSMNNDVIRCVVIGR